MLQTVEMRGICKRFGSLIANDHVDLDVHAGEVHALLGENGAGKSTLMKILYGLYAPDDGEIRINGEPARLRSPAAAIEHGIGMVSQHFALIRTLTVAENVVLGMPGGLRFDLGDAVRRVTETAQRYAIHVNPLALVRHLAIGEQQRVEILKALHRNVRVLILDEPTAVLTPQEANALFAAVKGLVAQGLAVVFISHKMQEVMAVSNRITVLRDGRVVGRLLTREATEASLAQLMVGRASFGVTRQGAAPVSPAPPGIPNVPGIETSAGLPQGSQVPNNRLKPPFQMSSATTFGIPAAPQRAVLTLDDVWATGAKGQDALRGLSLQVAAGEILAVAGVSGNGQSELAQVLQGLRRPTAGRLLLNGDSLLGLRPDQIVQRGVGHIPEDRLAAVIGEMTVAENLALEHLSEFERRKQLDWQAIASHATALIQQYQIKARPSDRIRTLSGGNVQKVILARSLHRSPALVVAVDPTRGLDIGATDYVRSRLLAERDRGAAVLLISGDLEEVLALADRIVVMYEGRIVGEMTAHEANAERLGLMMSGSGRTAARNHEENQ